jgi:gliding motility-associated-like protein
MRITLLFFLTVCLMTGVSAQAPDWQVNASQYNFSMVMVGLIKIDGIETTNLNDKIGAFINGELRGAAAPIFQPQANRNIFYLIIYHNDDGGNITFKYYNAATNTVATAVQTSVFMVDGLIGDVNKPTVWSDRPLRTDATLMTYRFPEQLGSRVYSDSVVMRVDPATKITDIIPDFTLSQGASLYINNERQISGETATDFDGPVLLTVRSEDEQTIKQYTVHVRDEKDEIPNVLFPNGTTLNRTWGIAHLGIAEKVKINVFDQNGHVLFSTTNPQQEWDGRLHGKQVAEGVYFYVIEREDGSKYQGSLNIIY